VDEINGRDSKSLRHLDQTAGINLLDYTGGKSMVPSIFRFRNNS